MEILPTASTIVTGQLVGEGKQTCAQQMRRLPTPAEAKLWASLRAGRQEGLHFRRQQIIDGFVVDFYCHDAGLVIELDGSVHSTQGEYDAERDRIIALRSLQIVRFSNTRIETDLPAVLTQIRQLARQRISYRPPPTSESSL